VTRSSSVVSLRQPDTIDDPLTAILRSGARRLLAQAIEAEAEAFLATYPIRVAERPRTARIVSERLENIGHLPEGLQHPAGNPRRRAIRLPARMPRDCEGSVGRPPRIGSGS
jgi:hypothetical protein